jgi:endonuclease IV
MIGPHITKDFITGTTTDRIKEANDEAESFGFNARIFQIFVAEPTKLKMLVTVEEAEELREYIDSTKIGNSKSVTVISHSSFAAYPWNDKPYPSIFVKKELKRCKKAGIRGLVVHLGKPNIQETMKQIPGLMTKNNPLIFLEIPSLKPVHSHYIHPKDIGKLFKAIRTVDHKLKCFGLCIDTAHLWTSGIDIQSYENAH